MASGCKSLYGYDRWPESMPDPFIGLVIGKKWRRIRDVGFPVVDSGGNIVDHEKVDFKDPWVPMLDSAKTLLSDEYFRVSEWTEQHFHDFVMYDKLITWGCASSSKALLPDEPVFYEDHIGTIGAVKVGDRILDAVGGVATVVGIREQSWADLYELTFSDGTSTICSRDHLWEVDYSYNGCRVRRVHSAVQLSRWTGSMMKSYAPSIPTTVPVAFRAAPVPIDPYVLGCLIGDGCLTARTPRLCSAEADKELRDEIDRRLARTMPGYRLSHRGGTDYSVSRPRAGVKRERNAVIAALQSLALYGKHAADKFIPECYKINSVAVRTDMLSGLLDTDGCVDSSGVVRYNTASERLAEDVKFLAESLGANVTVTLTKRPSYTYNGECRLGQPNYAVWIRRLPLAVLESLFHLTRKKSRVRESVRAVCRKNIVSVTKIENRCDYPEKTRCLVLSELDSNGTTTRGLFPIRNFTVTHNSNDTALLILLDWMVDPFDTVTLLGSTSKVDLKSRSWEAVVRYHNALRICNRERYFIPGKISKQGQALINVEDDDSAGSAGEKAGIQGRALNEDGRLQGAHAKYVRLVVDELAEITNHDAIKVAMANLRVGTESFKFIGLANPESWENTSCQYCIPPDGISSVNVDTGSWVSTFGCFVRHHDGLKSPCVRDPSLRDRFPFLINKDEVAATLAEAGGNDDAPQFWKMVRGFPVPSGSAAPVVLDARIATQQRVSEPIPFSENGILATFAGIDPAWSEGGDNAYRARAYLRLDPFGRPFLDFTDGLQRLNIFASDPRPPVQQMRDQVIDIMRRPHEAPFRYTAVDASANQGLADDLMIYAGADCLGVNNSVRASEDPLRANDMRPAKDTLHDRGTEAWCVLAEFCKAGMVRGLPMEALAALTTRRFAVKKGKNGAVASMAFPLRLEPKEEFKHRFKASPDACDACALVALAAKERFGLLPFGYLPEVPKPEAMFPNQPVGPAIQGPPEPTFGTQFDDTELAWCP